MANLSRPPKDRLRRPTRTGGNIRATRAPVTPRRQRVMSDNGPPNNIRNDIQNSWFTLELLYNITDIVLVICGAIVVLACIAHLALWGYGFYHVGSDKGAKRSTSNRQSRP